MSIGVQSSGINISNAELSRLADAGLPEQGDKAIRDDDRALARTDAALTAVVVRERVSPQRDADAGAQRVELTQPKPAAQTLATDRQTVSGLEREYNKRLAASQTPAVTGTHDKLVQQHASLADAKAGGDGAKRVGDNAPRAAAGKTQGYSFASDKGFDLTIKLNDANQKDAQSERARRDKAMMLASDATNNAAAKDRSIGATQMSAAIAAGMLQTTTSFGGAVQQMKGLNTKSTSIEKELKPQAELKQFHAEQAYELRGLNKPVLSNDGVSHVNVKRDTGEIKRYEINHGDDRLSDAHASVLAQDAPARQHRIDMHDMRHEENLVKASRQQMNGDLIQSGGQIGKNLIDGAAAQQQGADRAEQRLSESAHQVAMAMVGAHDDNARRSQDAMQKALEAAKSLVANSEAVAAQVAGNLRT